MTLLRSTSFLVRITLIGCLLVAIPLILVSCHSSREQRKMSGMASDQARDLAATNMDNLLISVTALIDDQSASRQRDLEQLLANMQPYFKNLGAIMPDVDTMMDWTYLDPRNNQEVHIDVPRLTIGQGIRKNPDPKSTTPLVDTLQQLTGGQISIHQVVNTNLDLLTVASTVVENDQRKISVFLPALDAEGRRNAINDSIVSGDIRIEHNYIGGEHVLSGYAPVTDMYNNRIAVFEVTLPISQILADAETTASKVRIGDSGFIYAFYRSGAQGGKAVIPPPGMLKGQSLTELFPINNILHVLETLPENTMGELSASVKGAGCLMRFTYYPPLDIVIVAQAFQDDISQAAETILHASRASLKTQISFGVACMAGAVVIFVLFGVVLSRELSRISQRLSEGSQQTAAASGQVSDASRSLAEGASQQAASLEQTSASLEEISAMIRQNAEHAESAHQQSAQTRDAASESAELMKRMQGAMNEIQTSSNAISNIIRTIDEIAFQTHILALNAAIEAAHAGAAGAGFAVVAAEVRSLAQNSAAAAKETATKIDEALVKSRQGAEICKTVASGLDLIADHTRRVDELVAQMAVRSNEQSQGIAQISKAVAEMEKVTQNNAASSEEISSSAQQFSMQSVELDRMVRELRTIVHGVRTERAANAIIPMS